MSIDNRIAAWISFLIVAGLFLASWLDAPLP